MTDREKLLALLAEFDIHPLQKDRNELTFDRNEVSLVAGSGNVGGYDGFEATFIFDEQGKFQHLHIWE